MKQFCSILCSKKSYLFTALPGILFANFGMEMMLCKCLRELNLELSAGIRIGILYLVFIFIFVLIVSYYLGEWINECKQELQVLRYCGITKKELKFFSEEMFGVIEFVLWLISSIVFKIIFYGEMFLFFGTIIATLVSLCIFYKMYSVLFFKYGFDVV